MRHALPNALLPVITISGVLLGFVLGGSVAVEQAFGVPGLGRALVTAVIERDIIVVQNLVLLYAVIFVARQRPGRPQLRVARPPHPVQLMAGRPRMRAAGELAGRAFSRREPALLRPQRARLRGPADHLRRAGGAAAGAPRSRSRRTSGA